MKLLLSTLAAMALFAGVAHADGLYVMGAGSLANFDDLHTDNLGYSGEAGWTNGTLAGGVEISSHKHLGNETLGAVLNGHVFTPTWHSLRLYGTVGIGSTFEGDPIGQAGGGVMWVANDGGDSGSFNIFAGYEHRCYPDSWDSFDCDSNDGYAKAGIMLTF